LPTFDTMGVCECFYRLRKTQLLLPHQPRPRRQRAASPEVRRVPPLWPQSTAKCRGGAGAPRWGSLPESAGTQGCKPAPQAFP
jgi:hypothetical protein